MEQLPVVSFRPEGHDTFMGLMMLMVGVEVEITYLYLKRTFDEHSMARDAWEVRTKRGEIVAMSEHGIALKPHGLPKHYSEKQYRNHEIEWERVKMLEVVG